MNNESISKKLSELFELYNSQAITKEEYDLLKSQLLNETDPIPPDGNQKETITKEELNVYQTIPQPESGNKKLKTKKKLSKKVYIPIVILIVVSLIYLFITHKSESQIYSDLLISKDLGEAYKFKNKFPQSTFHIDSLIQAIEYQKVIVSPSIESCRKYLETYSNDSIKAILSGLEWDEIKGAQNPHSGPVVTKKVMDEKTFRNNIDKIKKFYDEFPLSPHCYEIEEWQFQYQNEGTFIDKRDKQRYTWQKVGDQIWMTQNLNFTTQQSCSSGDKEGGRAYNESMIWEACINGWNIPTLEEWYTMLFDLGAKLYVLDYRHEVGFHSLLLRIDTEDSEEESVFKPYLGFNYVEKDYRGMNCGNIRTDGASYWSKTYEMERMNQIYAISKEDMKWNKSSPLCMHFERVRERVGISRFTLSHGSGGDNHPIRCIKKNNNQPSDTLNSHTFMPSENSGIVTLDGAVYNSDNLLSDGIYIPVGQNQEDIKNSILIKYVGAKLFFLISTGQSNLYEMKNYHILKSNDDRHFKLAILKNEVGEFEIINKFTIILRLNSANPLEYHIIPNLGVYFL